MKKNPHLIQQMTAAEYRDHPFDIVILPLGSLESHGGHLPFGTDALTAAILAEEVAEKIPGAAVLPVVPYGASDQYRNFSFTVSLGFETQTAIIRDILLSVYREGIRNIFILNGHDGNIAPIEIAALKVKAAHPDMNIITLGAWWESLGPLLPDGFFEVWGGLGHGGEGELSIGLALFEELCQPELARGRVPDLPEFGKMIWLSSEITDTGATGDPTKASVEKGMVMKETLVDAIVAMLTRQNETGWKTGYTT
ncbi:MAG: creatininase family protein [Methanocalculus sp. MSAO_Arc1]|uniref:creatininase family protein n=1 Tax=Methanocalculus TaxID=71151 RepID=UPI000FED7FC7|nr:MULTISPECIES: creatininase family protein [unclassified Methanocalculus]MCP1662481.1 creatinine amidohydrolase [Methanocalculus sp. AMF5]RQD80824.1 MAG: creatininase family protein [Methanocalculus sp. MSAO_Arc1]